MKILSILILFICGLLFQTTAIANQFNVFPNEDLVDLSVNATAPESGTFTVMNKAEEKMSGSTGDLIGIDGHKVIKVSKLYIVVEIVEIIDRNGIEKERSSRMKLPLAYGIEIQGAGKGIQ